MQKKKKKHMNKFRSANVLLIHGCIINKKEWMKTFPLIMHEIITFPEPIKLFLDMEYLKLSIKVMALCHSHISQFNKKRSSLHYEVLTTLTGGATVICKKFHRT